MRNWRALPISLAAALLLATPARADENAGRRSSSLAWVRLEGAESCIAGSALATRVEERLGRKVFVSAADADISVEGSVGRATKSGFVATLRVTSRDGTILGSREVETRAERCNAIDEKLSLVISVLIDPDSDGERPAPASTPQPPVVSPPRLIERERVVIVREAAPLPPEPWRFDVTLAAMGTLGLQPDIGLAFAPTVVLHPPRFWSLLIGGGIAASSTILAERGARVEATLAHGTVALCPLRVGTGRVEATACAGALVGALRSRGIGFDTTTSKTSVVAGPLAAARTLLLVARPIFLSLGVGLVVPLAHAEVGYRTDAGASTLYRTSSVAAFGELGIGGRFP